MSLSGVIFGNYVCYQNESYFIVLSPSPNIVKANRLQKVIHFKLS